ncbi:type VI secretion system Vgr family protein [Chryseobacterium paridis]|uniref:Gp5/Type VI secretion system Vgr protein OB-fold domain-containing protein n=1 Tax=Chryseobacterium paridis TaxID=2800328 RepID=A0ABS1FXV2_9FLAO|nr:hypothetical protein [Chryseobacterium paridis]
MNNQASNSEKILENHISGINRVVKLDIVIEGKAIDHFKHFSLQQSARRHHDFELILAHDSLGEIENHNLEEAQKFLGKRITVVFKYKDAENESPERTFVGLITNVAFSQEKMSLGNIVLKGKSPTILMDSAPHTQSFGGNQPVNTSIIGERIIKETLGTGKFDYRIDAQNKSYINYSSQYNETHYNYLTRIAEAYGEQFYYDGEILHFGKLPSSERSIELVYGSNVNDVQIELKAIHTKPEFFGYNSSNHAKMIGSDKVIKHLGDLPSKAYELNEDIFTVRSLTPTPVNANMFMDVEDSQNSARGSKAVEVFAVSGNTTVPFLYIGCVADINMRKPDSNETSYFTKLMITEVSHNVDARGYYTGSFEAIAEGTGFMPRPDFVQPKAEPQIATVISNIDPLNQGRIQVRFDWQIDDTTHFIRMMSPDAGGTDAVGKNRGFVAIPEIGDQVMVGFEYHNPDFPFAMGGMFHGGIALGGGLENHLKSIQTRSGIKILMNDTEKSVTIEDPSGNTYFMDGQGNINVTAPNKIIMNATDIQLNAYNNLELNVSNNVIINAMSKFFVFTPYMKQVVTGFMGLFSGKALFSSKNTLNIEASEAKLHGTERTLVHSDKQAIINSKGTAEMYGESGNQLGNTAKKAVASATETIAIAMVYFRPHSAWNGEFGFDWIREKDNGLTTEPAYADIIEGGYKDGATDLTGGPTGTAYPQLKTKYSIIPISRKPLPAGAPTPAVPPSVEYLVPYLTIFSKDFVNSLPASIVNKPKYEAKLKVLVEIEEDVDKLEFDLSTINKPTETFITIDKTKLQDKAKTSGLVNSASATIKVTCLKDLNSDKEIKIYAYPKGSMAKTPAEQLVERKLVGKINVLRNDATARKNQNFVLVPVRTKIDAVRGIKTGAFSPGEKKRLQEGLYQCLITSELKTGPILDLTGDAKFRIITDAHGNKTYGDFIYQNTSGNVYNTDGNIFEDKAGIFDYVKNKFIATNPTFAGYYTMFSFNENTYDSFYDPTSGSAAAVPGQVQDIKIKNVILFNGIQGAARGNDTISHEGLHGLGLHHTHKDGTPIADADRQFVYANGNNNPTNSTDNIMSYGQKVKKSTWKWQWDIAKGNV